MGGPAGCHQGGRRQTRLDLGGSRFVACPLCARTFARHVIAAHADACQGAARGDAEDPPAASGQDGIDTAGPDTAGTEPVRRSVATLRPMRSGATAMVRVGGGKGRWRPTPLDDLPSHVPVRVFENALPRADADALLAELLAEGSRTWEQDEWWIAGEPRLAPRLTAVYDLTVSDGAGGPSEEDAAETPTMRSSGVGGGGGVDDSRPRDDTAKCPSLAGRTVPHGMLAAAARAGEVATAALGCPRGQRWAPTVSVGNLYRTGADRVGRHADRLTSLGPLPTIVGLSLGGVRTFRVRTRWPTREDGADDVTIDIPLPHNSFCVMLPPCQELWTHEVVREGGGKGRGGGTPPRVSLTFRRRVDEWAARAPLCDCGRRSVLKTRRANQPPPAFVCRAAAEGAGGIGTAPVEVGAKRPHVDEEGEERERTGVMYYYTCNSVNGGRPCAFYKPLETRWL